MDIDGWNIFERSHVSGPNVSRRQQQSPLKYLALPPYIVVRRYGRKNLGEKVRLKSGIACEC